MQNFDKMYNAEPEGRAEVAQLPPPWDLEVPSGEVGKALPQPHYRPDPGLQDAVNTALLLRRPLLLTGEAGTGKTALAYHLAWKLGFGPVLRFDTKTTSSARDLFYTYDAFAHSSAIQLHVAQQRQTAEEDKQKTPAQLKAHNYITLNPLGQAILLALDKADLKKSLVLRKLLNRSLADFAFERHQPCCSVVLIDEIDKAPRDFPNDLLNELEDFSFRIPELVDGDGRSRIGLDPFQAKPELRPVLVITSNSEKDLPDPFLRRCVYYNIPFPLHKKATDKPHHPLMEDIVRRCAQAEQQGMVLEPVLEKDNRAFLLDALALFYQLRNERIRKKPSTAELFAWLYRLRLEFANELRGAKAFPDPKRPLCGIWKQHNDGKHRVTKDLGILLKHGADTGAEQERAVTEWAQAKL